jgi:hypothetical protein
VGSDPASWQQDMKIFLPLQKLVDHGFPQQ